jgi:RimJ/RimL family protein N-acetyltransferase
VDLHDWTGVPAPTTEPLEGRYVRLEPIDPAAHAASLYEASAADGAENRFRYLFETPPAEAADIERWAAAAAGTAGLHMLAVVDRATGRAEGRQALMRIDTANGVIEVGHILWGPRLARTRGATESIFLLAEHVFGLGYRRFEWKCNDANAPSKRAAERFGFTHEGTFRQHMVAKGENRDTAWFSILDHEWPRLRKAYVAWLAPANFDGSGQQLQPLQGRERRDSNPRPPA